LVENGEEMEISEADEVVEAIVTQERKEYLNIASLSPMVMITSSHPMLVSAFQPCRKLRFSARSQIASSAD
jgi:antitoxin (DNA-binding transcriptional repressor) of toxin-antitoxin stability system